MNFANLIRISYQALIRNKTRALLTMLGVVIGISSVIAMVSLGQSSKQNITNQISSMGTNLIMVMRSNQSRGGVSMGNSSSKSLTINDCNLIEKGAKNISYVSPSVSASGQVVFGNNNMQSTMQGGSVDILKIRKYDIVKGVNFSQKDVDSYAKVCLIGQTVVETLFTNGENPVGQEIRFNNTPLKVIGVLGEKGENQMGQDQDDIIFLPYSTVMKRILATQHLHMIYCSAKSEDVADKAISEIENILRASHKITDGMDDDFQVRAQSQMLEMMNSVTGFITVLLSAIASISLIVGGIGIMNIMYVTVTERTKEIGLRTAIGARSRDIMFQFLIESAMLSLIGGLIGIIFGLLISYLVSTVLSWPFVVNTTSIIVSFLVCAATGIFFGWYPAKKAANLDPITALRYE